MDEIKEIQRSDCIYRNAVVFEYRGKISIYSPAISLEEFSIKIKSKL